MYWADRITNAYMRGFELVYDLPERDLPPRILDMPALPRREAHHELIRIAARAHGVATYGDLRDYFRLAPEDTKRAISELVEEGVLLPVSVEGWDRADWLFSDARSPRITRQQALLAHY